MAGNLKVEQTSSADTLIVKLTGKIDETAEYGTLNLGSLTRLTLDLSGISLINSVGIQRWIKFIASVPAGVNIEFEKCPPRIINQLNMFSEFTAGKSVEVRSFNAPYFCEKCDKPQEALLQTADVLAKGNLEGIVVKCPQCQNPLEFDGIEAKYLLFLNRKKAA